MATRKRAPSKRGASELSRELIEKLPKTDLHLHLDGSLRLDTLIELAKARNVKLPSSSRDGLLRTVFKRAYQNLPEYLKGFEFTVACLQDPEALERVSYELCWDNWNEGVHYIEIRFAPQLHVREGFSIRDVLRAVSKGVTRARQEINRDKRVRAGEMPPFEVGIIGCGMRFFLPVFSPYYKAFFEALPYSTQERIHGLASLELARALVQARDEDGLPVVALDLAGQERGYPAVDHVEAYRFAHQNFLGKTVHAGEDYGPESIFQAITECHADRIGHGTWLFSASRIQDKSIRDKKGFVEQLVRYVADRRITLEVCLTSNQQTLPELRDDLRKHPFRKMRQHKISTTICTDNRLVSRTTVTDEVHKAVETFGLTPHALKDLLTYGFKRGFHPGAYIEKRTYVRQVIDYMEMVFAEHGLDVRPPD